MNEPYRGPDENKLKADVAMIGEAWNDSPYYVESEPMRWRATNPTEVPHVVTAELEQARQLAMSQPRGASAAVAAIMGKAKLHGLLTDKHEHTAGNPLARLFDQIGGSAILPKMANNSEPKAEQ